MSGEKVENIDATVMKERPVLVNSRDLLEVKAEYFRGFRGFIIRSLDNYQSLTDVWRINRTRNGGDLNLWSSFRNQTGRQALFNKTRTIYDTGAYQNSFHNIIPFIGKESHNTLSLTKSEAIDRGVSRIIYDPTYETVNRKQYIVAIDVWNLDMYWINFLIANAFLSCAAFFTGFYRSYVRINKAERELEKEFDSDSVSLSRSTFY